MCRKTIARWLTPRARAARTWSLERWESIEPRSSRAKIGTCTAATAMMTVSWLGRAAIAAIENASSSEGIESSTSTTRMTRASTQPPNAPARMPRVRPPVRPKTVATTPTMRVCWLPTRRRESRSRPTSSVPSGKPGCGPGTGLDCGRTWSMSRPAAGSWGAMNGETIARTTKSRVIVAPMRKTGLRRSRCHALAMSETPGFSSTLPASRTAVPAPPPALEAARESMRSLRRFIGLLGLTGSSPSGR